MGSAVILSLSSVAGWALGPITFNFFTPESLDPNKVISFTDTNTQTASGTDLVVHAPDFPTMKGIELHSRVPGDLPGTIRDITSLQVSFNYFDPDTHMPGMVDVQTFGSTAIQTVYDPWTVTGGLVNSQTGLYLFTFTQEMTSAPINDNYFVGPNYPHGGQSFATATVTGDDLDLSAFIAQNPAGNVKFTPNTTDGVDRGPADTIATPELGSVFSLGGLLAGGCTAMWIRRRRRNS
jgi:hypothetical protein